MTIDIKALRALSDSATPGPWVAPTPADGPGESMFWGADGWTVGNTLMWDNEEYIEACRKKGREPYQSLIIRRPDASWRADTEFLVAAVNYVRAMLADDLTVSVVAGRIHDGLRGSSLSCSHSPEYEWEPFCVSLARSALGEEDGT